MGSRAPAAARVSDIQQMQLWVLAPVEMTWLGRALLEYAARASGERQSLVRRFPQICENYLYLLYIFKNHQYLL